MKQPFIQKKKIGILSCGWLGTRLAQHLDSSGYTIHTTTTSAGRFEQLEEKGWHPDIALFSDTRLEKKEAWPVLKDLDAVVISTPFSRKSGSTALDMRLQNLAGFLGTWEKPLFFFSSIGIYPDITEPVTEDNLPESQLHPSLLRIEKQLRSYFPQATILRLGGLMGDDRYFSKYFQARPFPEPDQPVNHIHFTDICLITERLLENPPASETFNLVAPLHPSKQQIFDFQTKGLSDGRPAASGRIVSSGKIISFLDYTFRYPDPRMFT